MFLFLKLLNFEGKIEYKKIEKLFRKLIWPYCKKDSRLQLILLTATCLISCCLAISTFSLASNLNYSRSCSNHDHEWKMIYFLFKSSFTLIRETLLYAEFIVSFGLSNAYPSKVSTGKENRQRIAVHCLGISRSMFSQIY